MKKLKQPILLLIISLFFFYSCDVEDETIRIVLLDPENYIFIDSVDYPGDFSVQLYQEIDNKTTTTAGYNRLLFAVYDCGSNNYVKNLSASSTLKYSNDDLIYPSLVTGFKELEYLQQLDTYFAYQADESDYWVLSLDLNFGGKNRSVELNIKDVQASLENVQMFGYDEDTYQVTLIRPLEPDTGVNALEFMIDKLSTFEFTRASQFTPLMEVKYNDSILTEFITTPIQVADKPGFYRGAMLFVNVGNYKVKVPLLDGQDTAHVLEYLFSPKF